MGITVLTPPVGEAVTADRIKAVTGMTSDTEAALLARSAREFIERLSGRTLLTATLLDTRTLGDTPVTDVVLYGAPVRSIVSVSYRLDAGGGDVSVLPGAYVLSDNARLRFVQNPFGGMLPVRATLSVTYIAGYGAAADVPGPLLQATARAAMLMYGGVQDAMTDPLLLQLVRPYRVLGL